LDYRVEFKTSAGPSSVPFTASTDAEAMMIAFTLYRGRAEHQGFELWQGNRLVHHEPLSA
jgi:hypothetical protein